jgi:hypothetical protein
MRQIMIRNVVLALAATAAMSFTAAAPALAGPAEQAFLQTLKASWTGKGKISGPNGGPIACRIVITAGGQNAKFQGRCSIPDMAQQAFNGVISYNDKAKRYETRSASGTVPGIKRGNSLIFTTKDSSMGGTAYSTMTISAASLKVQLTFVDKDGTKSGSTITFSK